MEKIFLTVVAENGKKFVIECDQNENPSEGSGTIVGSKTKTVAPIDIERHNTLQALAEALATESRLEQMAQKTFDLLNGGEVDIKKMGEFLKNVMQDIVKEELDTIAASGFTMKDLNGPIAKIARAYVMREMAP